MDVPKLLIHLATKTTKLTCGTRGAVACDQVKTAGSLYPTAYFAYLMVAGADAVAGVGGLQCGIQYDGRAGLAWMSSPGISAPRSNSCRPAGPGRVGATSSPGTPLRSAREPSPEARERGISAAAGSFYMGAYTPDLLRVTNRPVDDKAKLADCLSNEMLLFTSDLGAANFTAAGNVPGIAFLSYDGGLFGSVGQGRPARPVRTGRR